MKLDSIQKLQLIIPNYKLNENNITRIINSFRFIFKPKSEALKYSMSKLLEGNEDILENVQFDGESDFINLLISLAE